MASYVGSPFSLWRRNTWNVLQMGEKMGDYGVPQPMTTRLIKSGAFVKVSMAFLRNAVFRLHEFKLMGVIQ